MGNCFSKKKLKNNLTESDCNKHNFPLPTKLSTIVEERTIDINVTIDNI